MNAVFAVRIISSSTQLNFIFLENDSLFSGIPNHIELDNVFFNFTPDSITIESLIQ